MICQLPRDIGGRCRGDTTKVRQFFFEQRTKRCKIFNYGGCGGNANRFESKAQCKKACLQRENMSKF